MFEAFSGGLYRALALDEAIDYKLSKANLSFLRKRISGESAESQRKSTHLIRLTSCHFHLYTTHPDF